MIRVDVIAETIKAMVEIMVRIPQCVRVTPQISSDTVGRQGHRGGEHERGNQPASHRESSWRAWGRF